MSKFAFIDRDLGIVAAGPALSRGGKRRAVLRVVNREPPGAELFEVSEQLLDEHGQHLDFVNPEHAGLSFIKAHAFFLARLDRLFKAELGCVDDWIGRLTNSPIAGG